MLYIFQNSIYINMYYLYGPSIDIGTQSAIIATVKKEGIEIVLNESSNRLRRRRRFDPLFHKRCCLE